MSNYQGLRVELRALGYDESVISDQALRQSLNNAEKRAKVRAETAARESRNVSREQLEEFVREPFVHDANFVRFHDKPFHGYQQLDAMEVLTPMVRDRFDVLDDTAEIVLRQNWDLVTEFRERFDRAMIDFHMREMVNNVLENAEYVVRVPRDEFVRAMSDAYDKATCQFVMDPAGVNE